MRYTCFNDRAPTMPVLCLHSPRGTPQAFTPYHLSTKYLHTPQANMKLHLPKQLFTALLAALTLATPTALTVASRAWADSISVNFHRNNQDDEKVNTSANANSTLLGVDAEDWNDVRVGEDGENTQNITVNTADGQTATMALTTKQAAWAPGSNLSTLEATLQKSYLDVNIALAIIVGCCFQLQQRTEYACGGRAFS